MQGRSEIGWNVKECGLASDMGRRANGPVLSVQKEKEKNVAETDGSSNDDEWIEIVPVMEAGERDAADGQELGFSPAAPSSYDAAAPRRSGQGRLSPSLPLWCCPLCSSHAVIADIDAIVFKILESGASAATTLGCLANSTN